MISDARQHGELRAVLPNDGLVSEITNSGGFVNQIVSAWSKSDRRLSAQIIWDLSHFQGGIAVEAPFLVVENSSKSPINLTDIRWLKGNCFRRVASRSTLCLDYDEDSPLHFQITVKRVDFPLTVKPESMKRLVIAGYEAVKMFDQAWWFSKIIGYIFRRPFVWIELRTLSGDRIVVSGNDIVRPQDRFWWTRLRWLPRSFASDGY